MCPAGLPYGLAGLGPGLVAGRASASRDWRGKYPHVPMSSAAMRGSSAPPTGAGRAASDGDGSDDGVADAGSDGESDGGSDAPAGPVGGVVGVGSALGVRGAGWPKYSQGAVMSSGDGILPFCGGVAPSRALASSHGGHTSSSEAEASLACEASPEARAAACSARPAPLPRDPRRAPRFGPLTSCPSPPLMRAARLLIARSGGSAALFRAQRVPGLRKSSLPWANQQLAPNEHVPVAIHREHIFVLNIHGSALRASSATRGSGEAEPGPKPEGGAALDERGRAPSDRLPCASPCSRPPLPLLDAPGLRPFIVGGGSTAGRARGGGAGCCGSAAIDAQLISTARASRLPRAAQRRGAAAAAKGARSPHRPPDCPCPAGSGKLNAPKLVIETAISD